MSSINYEAEAHRIISLLKKDFLLPDGSFMWERNGDYILAKHNFPDLGDYLPFLLFFGEKDFVRQHMRIYEKLLKDGMWVSEFKTFGIKNLVKSYDYTDLLLGIVDYDIYEQSASSNHLLQQAIDVCVRCFNLNTHISSFYHYPTGLHIPVIDTRDGTFIEIFIRLYNTTKNITYLQIAQNIYNNLTSLRFYKTKGVLPEFSVPMMLAHMPFLKHKTDIARICKNNTNSMAGFLELYKVTHDEQVMNAIKRIVKTIQSEATIQKGGVSISYFPHHKVTKANLTASFTMLDLLCDLYVETQNKMFLSFAEDIAGYWIDKQGSTGLFPAVSTHSESFLDSETDMSIALIKLFEITQNKKYKNSADQCLNGIITYHGKHDYVLSVHIETGEVINRTQRTKFLALFLKILIVKLSEMKGEYIYNTPDLLELIKDR